MSYNPTFGVSGVTKVGTPVDNEISVWTGDGTAEGDTNFTWDASILAITGAITVTGTVDGIDISTDVAANTAKATNVPTALSLGTIDATTLAITSDGGADDVVLPEADTNVAGLLGADKWDEIVANTLKVTNATHTGQVTGATALALDITAVTAQPPSGVIVAADTIITNDGGTLSEATFTQMDTYFDSSLSFGDVSATGSPLDNQIAHWTDGTTIDGDSTFTWNGSVLAITGAITVSGNVDIGTEVLFTDRAAHVFTPAATRGILWVRSDSPNVIVFTDDDDTDFVLNLPGGGDVSATGSPLNNQIAHWTDGNTIDGDSTFTWDGSILNVTGNITLSGTVDGIDIATDVAANTAKATNVSTALSVGTVTATTFGITSDSGADDVVLLEADTNDAGLLGADKWDEIVANTLKNTNVSTALSVGTVTATTFGITSDGGADDVVLLEADTDDAGLLGADKWDEIVANTLKVTNATHTGQITGATALTLVVAAITGQTETTTLTGTDEFIVNDGGSIRRVDMNRFIVGQGTSLTSGLAGTDELLISDGGVIKKMDISVMNAYFDANLNFGSGDGDVSATGSPLDNQIAHWTDGNTIDGDSTFTWDGNSLTAISALTGSEAANFSSNISTRTVPVVDIINEHATGSGVALNVRNDATGDVIAATTTNTAGRAGLFYANVSTRTVPVVDIINDHVTGSGIALSVQNDATGAVIVATTTNAAGRAGRFYANVSTRTVPVVDIINDHVTGSGNALRVQNDSTSGLAIEVIGDVEVAGDIISELTNTRDIGAVGLVWANVYATLFTGTATVAQYADLAEKYEADAEYEVGTVVSFGGEKEITISDVYLDHRVAGVVSADPGFLMNEAMENGTVVALRGRIPCKVSGDIKKGDLLISKGDGTACAVEPLEALAGTILGKSLENFSGDVGVIEIVV